MSSFTVKENALLCEKYYYTKHKSGLDIYVIPKHFSTYYATLATKYGSIDNKFRIQGESEFTEVPNGIAHFLEHKMFENEEGGDSFELYAKTGAEANAFTSFLKTAYLFSCTDRFYESLEILLQTVTKPYFTPETVAKEQGIIAEEIGMMSDNPGWVLTFNMLAGMYRDHSVKINIAGSVQSISEITAQTLYQCYHTFYQLSNMVLIVCGDVDPEQIIRVADKYLKKKSEKEVESVYAKESAEVVLPYVEARMDVSKPLVSIGIKDTAISALPAERLNKSSYLSVILETLFGPSSPIYNELYESGLINGGLSYDFEHNHAFSFAEISAEANDADLVSDRILNYIESVRELGLNPELFERAKKVVYSQIIKSFDSTEEIGTVFLANIIDGIDAFDIPDSIASVSLSHANELIREYFQKEHYTVSVVKPNKS